MCRLARRNKPPEGARHLDIAGLRFDIPRHDVSDDRNRNHDRDPLRGAVTSGMAKVRTSDPPGRRPEGFLMSCSRGCG